jgi:hypothetical protein
VYLNHAIYFIFLVFDPLPAVFNIVAIHPSLTLEAAAMVPDVGVFVFTWLVQQRFRFMGIPAADSLSMVGSRDGGVLGVSLDPHHAPWV